MLRRFVLLGSLVALGLGVPPAADAAFVIKASPGGIVSLGGFQPGKDPTLAAAIRRFGHPSSLTGNSGLFGEPGSGCTGRWGRRALTIYFQSNRISGAACVAVAFVTQSVRIQGRYAKRWRTTRGLRVGDSTRRVRRLYRTARRHGGSYWLVWRHHPYGGYVPVLEALTGHGRVYAFRLWQGLILE